MELTLGSRDGVEHRCFPVLSFFSSKLFPMIILGLVLTAQTTGWFLTESWSHVASLELINIKGHTTFWIKSGRLAYLLISLCFIT